MSIALVEQANRVRGAENEIVHAWNATSSLLRRGAVVSVSDYQRPMVLEKMIVLMQIIRALR